MRRLAVLILLAATLAGCRTKEPPPDATATTATTLLPTTTIPPPTTTIDFTATPTATQLQDPAYWNAVLAILNRVTGDATRNAASTNKVDPAAVDALRQVYGPKLFPSHRNALVEVAAGRGNGMLLPPGDAIASVRRIVRTDSNCVALEAFVDFSKVNPTVPSSPVVVKLVPYKASERGVNVTPWMIDEQFIIDAPDDSERLCAA